MEQGRRHVPPDKLTELADIYGVSTTWLLGEQPSEPDALRIAARQAKRMSSEDLDRLVKVIHAIWTPSA